MSEGQMDKLNVVITMDIVDEQGAHFARYTAENHLTQEQLLMLQRALADALLGLGAVALERKQPK
jgi:hypothetical protein